MAGAWVGAAGGDGGSTRDGSALALSLIAAAWRRRRLTSLASCGPLLPAALAKSKEDRALQQFCHNYLMKYRGHLDDKLSTRQRFDEPWAIDANHAVPVAQSATTTPRPLPVCVHVPCFGEDHSMLVTHHRLQRRLWQRNNLKGPNDATTPIVGGTAASQRFAIQ